MAKKFKGSIIVLIILLLFCWPGAIIYFLLKREELRMCQNCGQEIEAGYTACPRCQMPAAGGPMMPPPPPMPPQ